jgi:ribosomal protein S13
VNIVKKKEKMQLLQRKLPPEVLVSVGLTLICGIGRRSAQDVCWRVGIGVDCRVSDMTRSQMNAIRQWLDTREREAKLEANFVIPSRVGFLKGDLRQLGTTPSSFGEVVLKNQPSLGQAFLENNLRGEQRARIDLAIASGSYRGQRHALGLPCRGQRTHTNARSLRHGKARKS